ncbi:hypothetical protein H920_15437 [Fukomys damarensis]|uniref:Uncharacterized protein n=1 Tax=Fukomys damarensis TaxID=885580 RepID=A0A091CX58_FUKDA|nr:hypothetical protein H920_15437 [Fukomys damarensis]
MALFQAISEIAIKSNEVEHTNLTAFPIGTHKQVHLHRLVHICNPPLSLQLDLQCPLIPQSASKEQIPSSSLGRTRRSEQSFLKDDELSSPRGNAKSVMIDFRLF